MVTKAIVEEIISEYEVTVRIPTLDAGSNFSSSTQNYNLANAIICVPPQCVYSPTKGDIVIVSFEDNDYGKPIILGCLFKESGNTSGMGANLSTLNVTGNTKLSTQTTIGNISYQQLQNVLSYKHDLDTITQVMDTKLDKTTSPRKVYCTNANGEQVHENLDHSVSAWSVVQRDERANVRGKAFYSNSVKSYTDSFWNYSGSRCVHVGTLKAGWDNHTLGGRIYTHNGFNINDKTQRIIDFNITVGNDGNGTSTVQGFATSIQGESAGYDWGSEAIYLVKTSSTTWEMYYVMAAWSDAIFEMTQAADSNNDFYFDFDSAHDNFVTEPTTYDLKIVPINNNPPKLEIDNNWGVVTGDSRHWYAAWKTEIPVRQNGVTRILKVIGGFTPTGEGQKTVNFRMVWDTNNDVFSTDCLGFYATGIRNGSTTNGWEYATWNKSAATLTQINEGSVWFAIGY